MPRADISPFKQETLPPLGSQFSQEWICIAYQQHLRPRETIRRRLRCFMRADNTQGTGIVPEFNLRECSVCFRGKLKLIAKTQDDPAIFRT